MSTSNSLDNLPVAISIPAISFYTFSLPVRPRYCLSCTYSACRPSPRMEGAKPRFPSRWISHVVVRIRNHKESSEKATCGAYLQVPYLGR
ncbi:hypothetical protein LZ31DRAFT_270982 [Colletotrichum somersetense]|nr:hypothetical protein LZ31DRAFT_270982 [Colletotrichum somersetense]